MMTNPFIRISYLLVLVLAGTVFLCGCNDATAVKEKTETTYAIAQVETQLGIMSFWLHDQTPKHKTKFIELANAKHYNQFTFNRVVRNFVIQGGCPDSPQYFAGSPFLLDPEFVDSLKHIYGALGMGRDDNPGKQSNACQFYVVNKEAGLPNLDGDYMIFGQLIKGFEVLELIERVKADINDQPLEPIPLDVRIRKFTKVELLDSLGFSLPE